MAGNTTPLFSGTPDIQSVASLSSGLIVGPTANTAQDGTSSATSMAVAFQAGANGSAVSKIRLRSVGSPAATVCRVFICSFTTSITIGTSNTATNTWLYDEITLPAVTLSQTVASPVFEIVLGIALPALYRILVSFGTSTGSAGTGYSLVVVGGDY